MNNLEQIVCQYYKDKNGNPMSYHIRRRHQISPKNFQVQLDGIPDEYRGIEVIEPSGLYRVYNADEIAEDSYWVRDDGNIFFHETMACKTVMLDYYSIGLPVVGAGRIYTLLDEEGNVIETLEDILEKGKTVIEALKTMSDVIVAINDLKTSTYEATKVISSLDETIDKGYELLTKLNAVEYIQRHEFTENNEEINKKIDESKAELKNKIQENISDFKKNLEKVEVYLNNYSDIAKVGTPEEDWSLAFDYVFKNVVVDSVATIKWNGRLKIKSTINLPKHVNICGTGLPWSGLTPTNDFNGEYVITDLNIPTHNTIKNIYIDFAYNKRVKGIKCLNPYDYTVYSLLVADGIGNTFLNIGGDKISQTMHIEDCIAYTESNSDSPICVLNNAQEFFLENNKFLFKSNSNGVCLKCDGVTNTLFLHNSFGFGSTGVILNINNYPKRLNGNLLEGNLFEGIGESAIKLIGSSDSSLEGSYNTIRDNSYFTSSQEVVLGNIANTFISDPVQIKYLSGVRRTHVINKYDAKSVTPYGNVEEYCDGAYKHLKAWFCIDEVEKGEGSYLYMYDKYGNKKEITIENNSFVIK